MRRLFPHPADPISVAEAYDVPRPRPTGRPWISMCAVSSLDGSIVIADNSRALSNPVDREVLLTLRSLADVVLVGARTVLADDYGPPAPDGPPFLVVSRGGVDGPSTFGFDERFWESSRATLLLPVDAPEVPVPSVRAGRGVPDVAAAVAALDARFVLCEGGATVNGLLAAAGMIDEVDLTLSPRLAGGGAGRMMHGAPQLTSRLDVAQICEDDGFLFLRYVRPPDR